jgi:uncharacterized protein involved in exopolysaccharide biosynthesis
LLKVLLQNPVYVATAKVNISTERANLTVQPTELTELTTIKLNESIVNSEVHVIRSHQLLERVVRALKLQTTKGGVVGIANAANDDTEIGQEALRLGARLRAIPIRASNVIQIQFPASDPSNAATLVNRLVDEYLLFHGEVHGPQGLTSFYDEQRRALLASLDLGETALRDFSVQEGVVYPKAEIQAEVSGIARTEESLRNVNVAIVGTEERLRMVREQLLEQPDMVKGSQLVELSPAARGLREQVVDRRVERVALLRKYTEKSRLVRDNQMEIDDLEAQLGEALRREATLVTKQLYRVNPIQKKLMGELLDLEAALKEQRARKAVLESDAAIGRRRLVALKKKAIQLDRLEQDVRRSRDLVELFDRRAQEARIGEAMDREKLVNVEVIERPALPLPRTDDRSTPLLLALVSGLAVALGGAFGAEYLSRTVRFDKDVEKYLGLPVLASIPDTKASES